MRPTDKVALVVGASSDIGLSISELLRKEGYKLFGTYRTQSENLGRARSNFVELFNCDLTKKDSIKRFVSDFSSVGSFWDVTVYCPGTMAPIGLFPDVDFDQWEQSFFTNFFGPARLAHALYPFRRLKSERSPISIFFAGGGVNGCPKQYSSYTCAKIALIKLVEFLDAELVGVRALILGPGWVRTKIHKETLDALDPLDPVVLETKRRLQRNDFNSLESLNEFILWAINQDGDIVGGRNFSLQHDPWGDEGFTGELRKDKELFRLRRNGNDLFK